MKGMQALTDEGMQTVAHMDLMRSLAKLSSSVVIQGYGASLLQAGMSILQNPCGTAKRVAAAQLLESVLKIADADLLDLDISPIVGALQECQQDNVAGVRTAVADALRTASMYATYDTTSQKAHVPASHHFTEEDLQQSPLWLQKKLYMTSPAIGYNAVPDFLNCGTPCHSTVCTLTPSSDKSDRWLKRLPLAPLQQSLVVNPTVAPSRRKPATFKVSDYKENVAPAHNSRLPTSSRNWTGGTCILKRESPMLWPKNAMRKAHSESVSLFDSPQTPLVSFCGDTEAGDGEFSVNTLLEKHFGKQTDFSEDQFQVSLGKSTVNMTGSFKDEICYRREEQYGDGEVCNSFNRDTGGRRSTDSASTNMCCGTEEGLYSPSEESASDCGSSVTLEQGSNSQVAANQALAGDLLMTPKRLICSLQYDDEYESSIDQENFMESDATGCGMYNSSGSMEYDKDSKVGTASEESIANSPRSLSEDYHLHYERDTQMNTPVKDSGMGKTGVGGGDDFSDTQDAVAGDDEGYQISGGISSLDTADGQIMPPNAEFKIAKPIQKTQSSVCRRLCGIAWGFLLLFIVFGIYCDWVTTYMGNLEALNTLVPT
eukprot:c14340_g1_i1 orf=249-2045(+)